MVAGHFKFRQFLKDTLDCLHLQEPAGIIWCRFGVLIPKMAAITVIYCNGSDGKQDSTQPACLKSWDKGNGGLAIGPRD